MRCLTLPNIMTGLFVSRNLQKSGFLPVCQPVFCKFLERMAPVTPARFTFGYGLGHNIIWIYACDQSRKYVNHVMLWLCYITVPWEFPGGSPRRFPESRGNSYYLQKKPSKERTQTGLVTPSQRARATSRVPHALKLTVTRVI